MKIISIAALSLGLIVTPAAASDGYRTYGLATMDCGEVLHTYTGQVGDLIFLTYIGGYVTGLNAGLPNNDDVSNSEDLDSLVRMTKITCKAHKMMNFEQAVKTILVRIEKQSAE